MIAAVQFTGKRERKWWQRIYREAWRYAVGDCSQSPIEADGYASAAADLSVVSTRDREFDPDDEASSRDLTDTRHPMQPIVMVGGVARFRKNRIVKALVDAYPDKLNGIARGDFDAEDRTQLAQLIGCIVSGAGDLDYFDRGRLAEADAIVERMILERDGIVGVVMAREPAESEPPVVAVPDLAVAGHAMQYAEALQQSLDRAQARIRELEAKPPPDASVEAAAERVFTALAAESIIDRHYCDDDDGEIAKIIADAIGAVDDPKRPSVQTITALVVEVVIPAIAEAQLRRLKAHEVVMLIEERVAKALVEVL